MSTTNHPMTGLRRVILDAIHGIDPDYGRDLLVIRTMEETGFVVVAPDYGPGCPMLEWSPEKLESASTDDLLAMYDTLRPGVLEAMGSGE